MMVIVPSLTPSASAVVQLRLRRRRVDDRAAERVLRADAVVERHRQRVGALLLLELALVVAAVEVRRGCRRRTARCPRARRRRRRSSGTCESQVLPPIIEPGGSQFSRARIDDAVAARRVLADLRACTPCRCRTRCRRLSACRRCTSCPCRRAAGDRVAGLGAVAGVAVGAGGRVGARELARVRLAAGVRSVAARRSRSPRPSRRCRCRTPPSRDAHAPSLQTSIEPHAMPFCDASGDRLADVRRRALELLAHRRARRSRSPGSRRRTCTSSCSRRSWCR